jgi:predicted  nucleic acid-binding Zn-ribbon protein
MKTVFRLVLILVANLSDACKVEEELDMMQNTIKTTEAELQEAKDQLSKVEERLMKSLKLHQSNVDIIAYLEREVSIFMWVTC